MRASSTFLTLAAVAAIVSVGFAANLQLAQRPKRYSFVGFAVGLGLALAAAAVAVAI